MRSNRSTGEAASSRSSGKEQIPGTKGVQSRDRVGGCPANVCMMGQLGITMALDSWFHAGEKQRKQR